MEPYRILTITDPITSNRTALESAVAVPEGTVTVHKSTVCLTTYKGTAQEPTVAVPESIV